MIIIDGGLTFTKVFDTGTDSGADGYTGNNAETLTLPNNVQEGDFAVLLDMAVSATASNPTFVTPAGWTNTINTSGPTESGNGTRVNISRKILTSGDPGAVITGMNGAAYNRKILLTLRPSRPIQTATSGGWSVRCEAGDPGSILVPAAAAAAAGAAVIVFGLAATASGANLTPFSWTPAADGVNSAGTLATRAGYAIYPTDATPVDHTIDTDDEGGVNGLAAGYFVFT